MGISDCGGQGQMAEFAEDCVWAEGGWRVDKIMQMFNYTEDVAAAVVRAAGDNVQAAIALAMEMESDAEADAPLQRSQGGWELKKPTAPPPDEKLFIPPYWRRWWDRNSFRWQCKMRTAEDVLFANDEGWLYLTESEGVKRIESIMQMVFIPRAQRN